MPDIRTRATWLFAALATAASLSACAVVPLPQVRAACGLLQIASDEADLAPAWYRRAGDVLHACGVESARETAQERACAADRRNGYGCEP